MLKLLFISVLVLGYGTVNAQTNNSNTEATTLNPFSYLFPSAEERERTNAIREEFDSKLKSGDHRGAFSMLDQYPDELGVKQSAVGGPKILLTTAMKILERVARVSGKSKPILDLGQEAVHLGERGVAPLYKAGYNGRLVDREWVRSIADFIRGSPASGVR